MACPTRIGTFCQRHILSKIIWLMLFVYMCGNLSYQWSQIGHAVHHIITKSDFRHTHSIGLAENLDEEIHAHWHKKLGFTQIQFRKQAPQANTQQLNLIQLFEHAPTNNTAFEYFEVMLERPEEPKSLFSSLRLPPPSPPPQLGAA